MELQNIKLNVPNEHFFVSFLIHVCVFLFVILLMPLVAQKKERKIHIIRTIYSESYKVLGLEWLVIMRFHLLFSYLIFILNIEHIKDDHKTQK